jgi:hypothetical protein
MFFRVKYRVGVKVVSWEVTHGEGSVGGDIIFHTKKWGPPAALSALLFLFGVFFLRQISVSRSDEKIGDKAH